MGTALRWCCHLPGLAPPRPRPAILDLLPFPAATPARGRSIVPLYPPRHSPSSIPALAGCSGEPLVPGWGQGKGFPPSPASFVAWRECEEGCALPHSNLHSEREGGGGGRSGSLHTEDSPRPDTIPTPETSSQQLISRENGAPGLRQGQRSLSPVSASSSWLPA